jgi:hypothetical protein
VTTRLPHARGKAGCMLVSGLQVGNINAVIVSTGNG